MELERVESINRQLKESFGIDTASGEPIWRVVWSEDQFEYRLGTYSDYTEGGIYLRTVTEVRYVPKYRQWIPEKYVLERLVVIPGPSVAELPAVKTTYEPIHIFEDANRNPLPPRFDACEFVIHLVYKAQGISSVGKYKDPMAGLDTKELIEAKNAELQKLQDDLFGNETDTGDALAHKEAIIVPRNYERTH